MAGEEEVRVEEDDGDEAVELGGDRLGGHKLLDFVGLEAEVAVMTAVALRVGAVVRLVIGSVSCTL